MNRVIENFTINFNEIIDSDNVLHENILNAVDNSMDSKNYPKASTSNDIEEAYTIVYTRTYNKEEL